jgi:hypothetical protein
MAANNAGTSAPWKLKRPNEELEPAGPEESLLNALTRLGPFKHKFQDDADERGPRTGMGGRIAVSEELATERVFLLATSLINHLRVEEKAPRAKDVVENLKRLSELGAALSAHLKSLDDITRHRLQTGGSGQNGYLEFIQHPLTAFTDIKGLPLPNESGDKSGMWADRLDALSSYADFCIQNFRVSEGLSESDPLDKGGNTNVHKSLYGSARWAFVDRGWHEYELFKPGTATGTEGGPFHLFLLDVFEYATGMDPEENSKLTHWLKHVAKVNRRYQEINDREMKLQEEMEDLRDLLDSSLTDELEKRFKALSDEAIRLKKEHLELWPKKYPFGSLAKKQRS